jgi:hypothetical protein
MRRHLTIATLLPLALLATARSATAQAPRAPRSLLAVRVLDEQGHPLIGARVTVGGVEREAFTAGSGEATLAAIPPGVRLVEVRRQGYALQRAAAAFAGGDTVHREVRMTPSEVELEGLVVTSWGRNVRLRNNGFYDRQRRGFGSFMTRDQIAQLHAYHATDIFRNMRGFAVIPSGSRDIVVTTRGPGGFGSCLPHVYVDGNRMFVRNAREQADALEAVPTDNIEAVEGYQGPATIPAEYNATGSVCGVLLIWTRG